MMQDTDEDASNAQRRLEPVILELEREPADILFIGHGSVIRCIMAYLQGLTPNEIPKVELRRGDIVQVTPSACAVVSSLQFRRDADDENSVRADGVKFVNHFFWQ